MATPNTVPKLYQSVIDDVVTNVREAFLDDGIDEQILQELKHLWESKLKQSKAVDTGKPETMGMFAQHQIRTQQPQTVVTQHAQQGQVEMQLPLFNQSTGQIEISGAAAAQSAIPGIFPGGTVTLQTANGPMQFIIQAPPGTTGNMVAMHGGVVNMTSHINQVDGPQDSSSEDDDADDDGDDDDDDDRDDEENDDDQGQEEEPLCSDDDISDGDPAELFDTDNVVVCQFDKINRAKNKWKFYLKDGIMNLNGKDFVFQKCNGDADW